VSLSRLLPLLLCVGGLAAGCAPEALPEPTARMGAPLALAFTQVGTFVDGSAQGLRLVARLEARAPLPAPATLSLRLPRGVRLLEGPGAPVESTVRGAGEVQELVLRVALDEAPTADLVLEARVEAPGFGVRAQARYGFGRAAALGVRARPAGPALPQAAMDGAL
jgi:hypothetical protein